MQGEEDGGTGDIENNDYTVFEVDPILRRI